MGTMEISIIVLVAGFLAIPVVIAGIVLLFVFGVKNSNQKGKPKP